MYLPKRAREVEEGAGRAEADERRHKGKVDSVPEDGPGLHPGGECLTPVAWKKALEGDGEEEGENQQSHGVVLEAFEEVATDAATEAAGEAATGTRDAGQGLVEAKGNAGSLWRRPGREGESEPGDEDEGFAEPEAGDAFRLLEPGTDGRKAGQDKWWGGEQVSRRQISGGG